MLHLCGGYWAWRDQIATRIMAPILEGPSSLQLYLVNIFNFGPFGVSLFFLISGFVIPFSLQKMSPGRFLIARAFRIYPTYLACLSCAIGARWLSAHYWHHPFFIDRSQMMWNALLVQNLAVVPSFDLVNWTLAIELKFYIVMAALALVAFHRRAFAFIGVSLLITAAVLMIPFSQSVEIISYAPVPGETNVGLLILRDLAFVPYMLVGTILSLHMQKAISTQNALVSIATLSALFGLIVFVYAFHKVPLPVPLDIYMPNIAVFSLAYVTREHFKPNKLFDFFASISYPLYAVHTIVGYASLRMLMSAGAAPLVALPITVTIVTALAYIVHQLVEVPTTRLGRGFGWTLPARAA